MSYKITQRRIVEYFICLLFTSIPNEIIKIIINFVTIINMSSILEQIGIDPTSFFDNLKNNNILLYNSFLHTCMLNELYN